MFLENIIAQSIRDLAITHKVSEDEILKHLVSRPVNSQY